MKKNYSYVSLISTDEYIKGILVLFNSLMATNPRYPFLVLVTPNISLSAISILNKDGISYKILPEKLSNPTDVNKNHRWFPTYSKLCVFDQTQYNKIVYLDADMFVLKNIDELFDSPHMSATNAGGMLPRKSSWTHLNSGLFVATPSHDLFKDMRDKIGKIEPLKSDGTTNKPRFGSDQDFLNSYYPNWPNQPELHLDHKYNTFHYYLDEYSKLFGYSLDGDMRPISIIHYASYLKPWNLDQDSKNTLEKNSTQSLENKALLLWLKQYKKVIEDRATQ